MSQKTCPLCGKEHDELIYTLEKKLAVKFIKKIREEHPQWVQTDGGCERCMNFYKNLVQHPKKGQMIRRIIDRVATRIRFKKFMEE